MEINKEELYKLYMEWVDKVAEECDWKTSFGPEEIVHAIARILETNNNLIKTPTVEISDKNIEKAAEEQLGHLALAIPMNAFVNGARWYRDTIKTIESYE
jgi:hypothetical protein